MDFSILFDFAATAADPEMFAYMTSYEMFKLHWVGPGNTSLGVQCSLIESQTYSKS